MKVAAQDLGCLVMQSLSMKKEVTFKHHHQAACNVEEATAKNCASNQLNLSLPLTHRLRMHNPVHLCQNTKQDMNPWEPVQVRAFN